MSKLVFIDRVEGDRAVMLSDDGQGFELPVSLLPAGASEGHWFSLSLVPDPARDAAQRDKARSIRDRLAKGDGGGDIKL